MNVLKQTKQKRHNKRIFGFDIETYNNNKDFVCASIIGDGYKKVFYDPKCVIYEIKTNKIFHNSNIFATNLAFDFFGTFFEKEDVKHFYTLFRGADLLFAKSYLDKDQFTKNPKLKTKALPSVTFLDSLNYAKLPVSEMGKILNLRKLEKPEFLGEFPQNKEEWEIMIDYNLRDSEITYKFMIFLINAFESLGATFKNTLASTSMSLFKNKYLDDIYFQPSEDILLEQFESYYGGRTEAFKRGTFRDVNYYDFNSLYPSVMRDYPFPDPNSLRISKKNTVKYIREYEGISHIKINVPASLKYPVLPYRQDNGRVVFPTGTFSGWYTHVEIREAEKHGCVVMNVYKTHYYKRLCRPFKAFVEDLYNLRLKYKEEKSPMEYVVKITMNSLYGKFGQKFTNRDNWVHESHFTLEDLGKLDSFDVIGDFIRIKENNSHPSNFCIPIWATYTTAYGRIKLHRAIVETDPIYCDTDSLITKKTLPESKELGKLKREMRVSEGIVIRPKFYALKDADSNKGYVKIKGLRKRLNYLEFVGMLHTNIRENKTEKIYFDKIAKFKEALRRDLLPNETINIHKQFSLEDEKRKWESNLNPDILQDSLPLLLNPKS